MSPARRFANALLHPLGICIGRIISATEMREGEWVSVPPPTGWRAYRVLPLRKA